MGGISAYIGLQVLKRIRAIELNPMPRIIILSAISDDKIIQKSLTLGADHYVIKPFGPDALFKAVRQMFNNTSRKINLMSFI